MRWMIFWGDYIESYPNTLGIISDSAQGDPGRRNRRKPPGGKDDRRPRLDAPGSGSDGTHVTITLEDVMAVLGTIRYDPLSKGGYVGKCRSPVTPSALSCNLSVSQEDTGMVRIPEHSDHRFVWTPPGWQGPMLA